MPYTREDVARAIVDHAGLMAEYEDPDLVCHQVDIQDIDGLISSLGSYAVNTLQPQIKAAHERDDLPPMTLPAIIQIGLFHGLLIGLRLSRQPHPLEPPEPPLAA